MNNQEILDEDQINNSKEVIDKRTNNLGKKTLIYGIIMLLGTLGLMYFKYRNTLLNFDFTFYPTMVIGIIILCITVSFVLEFFRFVVRKLKRKNPDKLTLLDPFWFQIMEGAFAIWIFFAVSKSIILAVTYFSFSN